MSLAQDLMGLGENPIVASRLASGGVGPVSITAVGTSLATAIQIYGSQYITTVTAISGGGCVALPAITGQNTPLIYDDFVLHNASTGSLTVFPNTGVTVNIGGVAYVTANPFTLTTLKTLSFWTGPTTTQWFGLSA
jgi:hypothetical protein